MTWTLPFEELEEGAAFRTRGRTITESDIVAFAALTGDWHPQHADAEWAAQSSFGQRIAHGMLVVSFAVGLVPLDPERVIALRRIRDVVFRRPIRIGDTIHVDGRIAGLRAATDEAGIVTIGLDVVRQDGLRACAARIDALWRTDAVAAEPEGPFGEMVWDVA
jgi:3-hydroxybutyryl-CoA dehydratase